MCRGQMRFIALIAFCVKAHEILDHIGVDPKAARVAPARVPPLGDEGGAQKPGQGMGVSRTGIFRTNHHPNAQTVSAILVLSRECGRNRPPGQGCVCGQPLLFVVATAAQIPEKSDGRL